MNKFLFIMKKALKFVGNKHSTDDTLAIYKNAKPENLERNSKIHRKDE